MLTMLITLIDIFQCSLPLLIDIAQPLVKLIGQRIEPSRRLTLGLTSRGKQLLLARRDRAGEGCEELQRRLVGECTAEPPCQQ